MAFIIDNRNGLGKSITVELQTETERQIGVDNQGRSRQVFFKNTPQIITKTTYNVIGTLADWEDLITNINDAYAAIDTVPVGKFIESYSVGGGWFIIEGDDYYSGTYVEADYSLLEIAPPDEEYKIIVNESASVSPSGYLPNGLSYYSGSVVPKKLSRTCTSTLTKANSYQVGTNDPTVGFITSKNISNPRLINGITYVDLSLEISELLATIDIF